MGRPRKKIDADMVERLASIQCTTPEIAVAVGCSPDTLERRFADVLERGRLKGKASLRRMQYTSAVEGNVAMQIWLGKNLLGQRDRHDYLDRSEGDAKLAAIKARLSALRMIGNPKAVELCEQLERVLAEEASEAPAPPAELDERSAELVVAALERRRRCDRGAASGEEQHGV